jgi:ketosteroid isomerase-like protein
VERNPLYRLAVRLAIASSTLRQLVFRLPPSRLRTAWLARALAVGYEGFNADEAEQFYPLYDPDIEFQMFMVGGTFRGRTGIREAWDAWRESFPDTRAELEEFIDAGGNVFIAVLHLRGRGSTSGIEIDQHAAQLWDIEDGRVVRTRGLASKEEALEAVGLREHTGPSAPAS